MAMNTQTIELSAPRTRKWSRDEYYQMADLGWFQDQRVELIGGEIIEMAAQRNKHYVAIGLVEAALRQAFGDEYWIRTQGPLHLLSDSAPGPDISVVRGTPGDFEHHPASALLVVEVSDTTLICDAGLKAGLYAAAGIADYWIVNLVNQRVEVSRNPVPQDQAPFGHGYAEQSFHERGASVAPLALPHSRIAVADLLP